MKLCISNVLDAAELQAISQALADQALFGNGAATAGAGAAAVKHNLQGRSDAAVVRGICEKVQRALSNHPTVTAAALPCAFARVMVNSYRSGMHYGWHSDEAFIDHVRTDLSFTLFLSEPDSYEGGALEVRSAAGDESFKLPAGSAVLYSSGDLHQVTPVTAGTRLAAVGWIQSQIRSSDQRALQFELAAALADLSPGDAATRTKLAAIRHKLLRMWSDPTT